MRRILLRFMRRWRRAWSETRLDRSVAIPPEKAPEDTTTVRSPQQTGATSGGWIGNLLPPP
jgi:hypothetical protein